jgi:hypothetical protein
MRFNSQEELLKYAKEKAAQVKSLGGDSYKWVASGAHILTQEQLNIRKDICCSCEFWNPSGFAGTGKCDKCGCSTQAKLRMSTSKCPIDKWGPVDVRQVD